jgi:hypothetical protein
VLVSTLDPTSDTVIPYGLRRKGGDAVIYLIRRPVQYFRRRTQ